MLRRRAGLSRGHTACHLASLALDAAVADLWRKEAPTDPLGHPDFEGRANQSSRISEDGSVDEYRLGKSLRWAGSDTEGIASTLGEREAAINAKLTSWVVSGALSRIVTDGPTIVDRRRWECALPEGDVAFPCGGTSPSPTCSNLWLRRDGASPWEYDYDVILMDVEADVWTYKRDARVEKPLDEILWGHESCGGMKGSATFGRKSSFSTRRRVFALRTSMISMPLRPGWRRPHQIG